MVAATISHSLNKDREKQIHKTISFHTAAEKFRHSFDDILLNIEEREQPVHELLRNLFCNIKSIYASGSNKRLARTDPFIPVNVDLGGTAKNMDEISRLALEETRKREKTKMPNQSIETDRK